MFAGEGVDGERLRAIRKFAIYPSRLPELEVVQAMLQIFARQDQRHLLAEISSPVMVLHGTADQITPIEAGRFLADAIPGARLKEYAGIGHAPFLSQPETFVEDLRSFIRWVR
jgi:pimeloyl-[acyl-carrier protein] methyl ester esterase